MPPAASHVLPPPLAGRGRMPEPDVIRGIAILGILLLNIRSFAMNDGAYWYPAHYDHFDTWHDRLVWLIGEVFWAGKFYGLLALLFGAGILLMAEREEAAGQSAASRHFRRMAGLLVIGLLHAYLLWPGDILFHYAICGCLAFFCRKWRPRPLVAVAAGLLILMGIFQLAAGYTEMAEEATDDDAWDAWHAEVNEELEILRGPWLGQMAFRAAWAIDTQTAGLVGGVSILGFMFVGMALVKTGWLGGRREPATWRRIAFAGCGAGWLVTFAGLCHWWRADFDVGLEWHWMNVWTYMGGILTTLGYLAAIQWWVQRGGASRLRSVFESVGRTALSNYLVQTVIATFIFYGQGFALIGHINRAGQLVFVFLTWGVQIALTGLWLKRHRHGPVELLLRTCRKCEKSSP